MKVTLQEALDHGARLLQAGRSKDARALADRLLDQFPESGPSRLLAADAAAAMNDLPAAFGHLDVLSPSAPEYGQAVLSRARLLFADGRRAGAIRAAGEAAALLERDPEALRLLAGVLRDCQQPEAARACLLKALEQAHRAPAVLYDLAMNEYHLNRPDEAERHLEALLEDEPYHGSALHLRSALRVQTQQANHVEDLRRRLREGPDQPRFVAAVSYALAKELEDLGRYDESAAVLGEGARAYRSTLKYDARAELKAHEEIRSVFSSSAFDDLGPGFDGESPVFVVGMPRTGTTLVERILSSHSSLASIGEFTEFPRLYGLRLREQFARHPGRSASEASLNIDFVELGRAYCELARELVEGAAGFVDKLPYNFLYCGYILAALPKARIIHVTRHPLDTCYAVYKTLFFGAYSFSYDLEELADYYLSYRKMMAHWHQVLPGRILDVAYEELVREPEAQMRRMFEWCGLPWEPSALEFHRLESASMTASAMQVRRPIHDASVDSWQRAEKQLAPLRARFEAAGIL